MKKDDVANLMEVRKIIELGPAAVLRFHLAMAKPPQNNLLYSLMNHFSGMMEGTMKETRQVWLFSKQKTIEKLADEHFEIYIAIRDKDEDAAQHFMKIYLENIEDILPKYYKHANFRK